MLLFEGIYADVLLGNTAEAYEKLGLHEPIVPDQFPWKTILWYCKISGDLLKDWRLFLGIMITIKEGIIKSERLWSFSVFRRLRNVVMYYQINKPQTIQIFYFWVIFKCFKFILGLQVDVIRV